jgi:hypothetical protein
MPADTVRAIVAIKSKGNPVNQLPNVEALPRLVLIIGKCCQEYWGINVVEYAAAIQRCARNFMMQHGNLSIDEISIAFSLAFAEDTPKTYGKFAVENFSPIIQAYVKKKAALTAQVHDLASDVIEEAEQKQREQLNQKVKLDVYRQYVEMVQERRNFERWEECPSFWAKWLIDGGYIDSDPEVWIDAKRTSVSQFLARTRMLEPTFIVGDIHSCRHLAARIEADPMTFPKELRPNAEVIYAKKIVFTALERAQHS